jgi:hypothetical protein
MEAGEKPRFFAKIGTSLAPKLGPQFTAELGAIFHGQFDREAGRSFP